MDINEDLRGILTLPNRELSAWLDAHAAASASPQWWWRIMESIESKASVFRDNSPDRRGELLALGARLLTSGIARGELSRSLVAYWQLRLAVAAVRSGSAPPNLNETLTPEGAVRWAVSNMPASREEIVSYARERASRYRDADSDFYATPGAVCQKWGQRDSHTETLQDVERVLEALRWIDFSCLESTLRVEAEAWLELRSKLDAE